MLPYTFSSIVKMRLAWIFKDTSCIDFRIQFALRPFWVLCFWDVLVNSLSCLYLVISVLPNKDVKKSLQICDYKLSNSVLFCFVSVELLVLAQRNKTGRSHLGFSSINVI